MAPGAAHVDPAVDLLRRIGRDVGYRGRGTPAGGRGGRRRGAAAVPEPRVVGELGDTPGFDYREHLERVIGQGSPPMPVLRELLFGD